MPETTQELERRGLREVFTSGQDRHPATLLPELEMLGWSAFPRAQAEGLGPHVHEDAFEVCCIVDGRVDWWVGETIYAVGRGDVFVTRPGEPHGGTDALMHPCELYWLQVRLDAADPLRGALAEIETRCFPSSPEIPALFARLMEEHQRRDRMFAAVAARALLHRLLVQVVRDYADFHQAPSRVSLSPPVTQAITLMSERLGEPFCIEEVACAVGLTPPRFHERFLRETGLTPAEWRVRRRIDEARRLLRAPDATVTTVAHALGFASSQYFATAFKKYMGRTPSEYRRETDDVTIRHSQR